MWHHYSKHYHLIEAYFIAICIHVWFQHTDGALVVDVFPLKRSHMMQTSLWQCSESVIYALILLWKSIFTTASRSQSLKHGNPSTDELLPLTNKVLCFLYPV